MLFTDATPIASAHLVAFVIDVYPAGHVVLVLTYVVACAGVSMASASNHHISVKWTPLYSVTCGERMLAHMSTEWRRTRRRFR